MTDAQRYDRLAAAVGASAFVLVDLVDLAGAEPAVLGLSRGTLFTVIVDDEDDASFLLACLTRAGAPRFDSITAAQRYASSRSGGPSTAT